MIDGQTHTEPRQVLNQRAVDRFCLDPMYTGVTVSRTAEPGSEPLGGHAYDISVAGVRLELDEAIVPGEQITARIALPGQVDTIDVSGTVVWVHDETDDPGPKRLAMRFTDFASEAHLKRLTRYLGDGWARRAA